MSNTIIIPVSEVFANKYSKTIGMDYDELLLRTAVGYAKLWKEAYKDHERYNELLAAEGMDYIATSPQKDHELSDELKQLPDEGIDYTVLSHRFAAFANPAVTPEDYQDFDHLQTGSDRAMFVAMDPETKAFSGLLQISTFNYSKFQEQKPDALQKVYRKACRHQDVNEAAASLPEVFAQVSKVQRYYCDDTPGIKDALLYNALVKPPHKEKSGLFMVSYPGSDEHKDALEMGYEVAAKSKTMDSQTACDYMLARRKQVVRYLQNTLRSREELFKVLKLSL